MFIFLLRKITKIFSFVKFFAMQGRIQGHEPPFENAKNDYQHSFCAHASMHWQVSLSKSQIHLYTSMCWKLHLPFSKILDPPLIGLNCH